MKTGIPCNNRVPNPGGEGTIVCGSLGGHVQSNPEDVDILDANCNRCSQKLVPTQALLSLLSSVPAAMPMD